MKTPSRKTKLYKKQTGKTGQPPGTLMHVGEKRTDSVRMTVIDYDQGNHAEQAVQKVEQCFVFRNTPTVTWINIDGLHDVEVIEKIGRHFDVHSLVLEDVLHTAQRPKFEDFERYAFIVLNMLSYNDQEQTVESEQVSLVLGDRFVISFQERPGDVFDSVRERIRDGRGRIRKMGADYLAYVLVDAIIDGYFSILEKIGEKIEVIEDELVGDPAEKTLRQIHLLKREMISLRKSVWPLRELISEIQRSESPLIAGSTDIYLRDVYDHTIQIIDTIESFRDMASGMLDIYLSSISNRMNAVMKVLTIIATLFIPLTFIVGVYGMNFEHMPELAWKWGYAVVWLIMLVVTTVMLFYFRKKKWL